jgi:regulator of sigma E protease
MSWVLALIGIFLLVILHELGHFAAAKATGMRVEQLSLFFGPKIVKVKRGETEYCIGTIPAGGYAKITGMNPEQDLPPDVAPRAYYAMPVWKRIVVILAGPAVNLVLAFLILFGTAFVATKATELQVGSVESGTPAAQKLEPGDQIVAIDGASARHMPLADQARRFSNLTNSHACPGGSTKDGCRAKDPVTVTVVRDGQRRTLTMRPYYDAEAERNRIGFAFQTGGFVRVATPSVPEAAQSSVDTMWQLTSTTVSTFAKIFDSQERKKLGSVVGATEATHQAFEFDSYLALRIIGLISLSLALVNLFPFLPLDGGHVFWSVVEKIRGRRPSLATMERASMIGILLVLVFAYVGISNDIDRLSNGGFDVR